jgi:hypothetical protein
MFVDELAQFWDKLQPDHVHQVKIKHVKNFQSLVFGTNGGEALLIARQRAASYLSHVSPESFHKF